jgi:2-dehydropantoate 2-reductase
MVQAVWHKLAVNASLNVVASLYDLKNGEVLLHRRACPLTRIASLEVQAVASALGIDWGPDSAWEITRTVAANTADNICSTLADLRSGRPTEYEAINGEILKLAGELGLHLPTLDRLHRAFQSSRPASQGLPVFSARLPYLVEADSDGRLVPATETDAYENG